MEHSPICEPKEKDDHVYPENQDVRALCQIHIAQKHESRSLSEEQKRHLFKV